MGEYADDDFREDGGDEYLHRIRHQGSRNRAGLARDGRGASPECAKPHEDRLREENARLKAENERLRGTFRDRLTKGGWTCAFLDGRNEHGCWVLSLPPGNLTAEAETQLWRDMDDQSSELAESVMKSAESHGFEAGMCVVLTVYFEDDGTAYDPQVDEELTVLFYGTPDEQRAALRETEI